MCEFISWIEKNNEILFLDYHDIYETKRGKELREFCVNPDDLVGHGAIRHYYSIVGGKERECTDFSSPKNFPPKIVAAIKAGKFAGLGVSEQLLNEPALAEYKKIEQSAWAEYKKIKQPAWAEYKKIEQSARAEYKKIKQPAWAEYEKIKQSALAEYEKIKQSAWAEYEKIEQPAWAEYKKIEQPAWAEYKKIKQPAFWKLFSVKKNRNPLWK